MGPSSWSGPILRLFLIWIAKTCDPLGPMERQARKLPPPAKTVARSSTAERLLKRNREPFMKRFQWMIFGFGILAVAAPWLKAEELDPKYKACIDKGLSWVAKNQHRDGHWEANGAQYPTTMTALGGMVLLMEGSTIKEGKYADNIRRAVDWSMESGRCQRNGLMG